MVGFNPADYRDENGFKKGNPGNPTPKRGGANTPKIARDIKTKVFDLRAVLVNALEPDELWFIARTIIDLAMCGNMDAATWIVDRCIGKPLKSVEITTADSSSDEPPKVVLLDWRRNGLGAAAESN